MANADLIGAPRRTDNEADVSAMTAPLPSAALSAMASLDRLLFGSSTADVLAHEASSYVRVTPAVAREVTRYEVASARTAELSRLMDVRDLSGDEFDSLFDAQTVMAGARKALAAAGQLHLVEGGVR